MGHMAGATLRFDDRAALANRDHLESIVAGRDFAGSEPRMLYLSKHYPKLNAFSFV